MMTMPFDEVPGLRLLTALDAFVKSDTAPSGVNAVISVGIREGATDWWWWFDGTGAVGETGFAAELPEAVEALMLLGNDEAESMLAAEPLEPGADLVIA